MELIALAHVDSPFNFSFSTPGRMPNPLMNLKEVSIGYPQKTVIEQANLTITPGDRIGLLGPNGAGKSSLVKVLAGTMEPLAGTVLRADALKIGYFAQHQLEQLRLDESPLWHLQKINPQAAEKDLRNFLGGFDFQGDKVKDPVKPFSGGEKARLVLAMLVYQNPNLLLLDEPTNHLDLDMRHALNVALQDFEGALVVVSHDRHLLRSVTDQLLLVGNGTVKPFDGDLEDYRIWVAEQRNKQIASLESNHPDHSKVNSTDNEVNVSRKDQRKQEAERRQRLKPWLDAVKKAEQQMEEYHRQQQQLEQQLTDPDIYSEVSKPRLKSLLEQKNQVDRALQAAEEAWLQAEQALAEIE